VSPGAGCAERFSQDRAGGRNNDTIDAAPQCRVSKAFAIGDSAMARKARVQFRLRITKGDDIAVGPGKIDLLEAVAATGSITAAARQLGMSYRRAWLLVDTMNRCFTTPVTTAEAGGKRGGGTSLTPLGAEVVKRYRRIEGRAANAAAADIRALLGLLSR
jgi:molybdate transport system regulatory protein